jgi:hypothetical protein
MLHLLLNPKSSCSVPIVQPSDCMICFRNALLVLSLVGLLCVSQSRSDLLETIAQWQLMNFAFPYDPAFHMQFEPENVVPTGIEVGWHRIFIAMPRLRSGVPATIAYIPRDIPLGSTGLQLQVHPSHHSFIRIGLYTRILDSCCTID